MLRKALLAAALLVWTVFSLAPSEATASNCYSECSSSYQTCPTMCLGSPSECWDGYLVCVDSCDRGVGPWLIC